jgi:hypothetical protein
MYKPNLSKEEIKRCNSIAEIQFPSEIQTFEYNESPLLADVRLKTVLIDRVRIDFPDNYFTFNPDGSRPNDILFVYTPGEHIPDWDYSKDALIEAARKNKDKRFIDGGCGTGIKACLIGKYLEAEGLDNPILLVDPNQRAIETTLANIRRNNLDLNRYSTHLGTLRSALPKYIEQEIAGAYINPPYQAKPDNINLALHCDGGNDGLKITRELLEDLLPYLADKGTVAVHTKSPAYKDKKGFSIFPLILEDLVEGKIIPKSKIKEYEIRFSRACEPMELFDFYRLIYREKENKFAGDLAAKYPLIDMTLLLITRNKDQTEVSVIEDPKPANPEGIGWGVKDRKLISPGHVLWHRLCTRRD